MTIAFDVSEGGLPIIDKKAADVLDYWWDWSRWMSSSGFTAIVSHEVLPVGSGGVVVGQQLQSGYSRGAMISGGTPGALAEAVGKIVATGPDAIERTRYFSLFFRIT